MLAFAGGSDKANLLKMRRVSGNTVVEVATEAAGKSLGYATLVNPGPPERWLPAPGQFRWEG
jgi:hypothetical protein